MKERQGRSWSRTEEQALREAFLHGADIDDLARRHQRTPRAIHRRLQRLDLLQEPRYEAATSTAAQPVQLPAPTPPPIEEGIEQLIRSLHALEAAASSESIPRSCVAQVAKAYDQLNAALLATVSPSGQQAQAGPDPDPAPDRLRAALLSAVHASVPDLEDRYVAIRTLALMGDGEATTLAAIGMELGVSRERARQRRIRAFRTIDAALPRRFATVERLRKVLTDLSGSANWTDPAQTAPHVVKLLTDNCKAAEQLTVMCCKAFNASTPNRELHDASQRAVLRACRDPEIHGRWTIDHWRDAAAKTLFDRAAAQFESPPQDLAGRKRLPGNAFQPDALHFRSARLGRMVACESGMELRVFSWLERSAEVLWYQEQPTAVPYTTGGKNRLYYPDVAVWDSERRVVVVEVKPAFMMYREQTAIKALAALSHFGPRGIGYLLVDAMGRSLSDLAYAPFDSLAAEEIESFFDRGPVPFKTVRDVLARRRGRLDAASFASMVINRDWAVTSDSPVHVGKLPAGISFRPLLRPA